MKVLRGRRGTTQMAAGDVSVKPILQKVRILEEQVTRHTKTFRTLSSLLPVSMFNRNDDF